MTKHRKGEGRRSNCSLFSSTPHHCLTNCSLFCVCFASGQKAPLPWRIQRPAAEWKSEEKGESLIISDWNAFSIYLTGEEESHPAPQQQRRLTSISQLYSNGVPIAPHQFLRRHQEQAEILQPPTQFSFYVHHAGTR